MRRSAAHADWRSRLYDGAPDGLILFDSDCVLCSAWVQFVIARDRAARFRFVTAQSDYGQRLLADMGLTVDDPESNIYFEDGRAYLKSDTALMILRRLPWPWRWASAGLIVPKAVRDWFYDRVARNRYRLFGRRDQCLVPTPELRARFLDQAP